MADGIYRLSTCIPDAAPGGCTFKQFVVVVDEPLPFHTGPRRMFPLADGEVIDLGGKRVRHSDTPHVPHNSESRVLFEEATGTLFYGDLSTRAGNVPAVTDRDIVEPALAAKALLHATSLSTSTAPLIRCLERLDPPMLALMRGSSKRCCSDALSRLADGYGALVRPG